MNNESMHGTQYRSDDSIHIDVHIGWRHKAATLEWNQIKQNFNQTQHSLRLVQASLAIPSLPQAPSLPSVLCGPPFLVLLSDPEGLEPLASQADPSPPAYNEQYKHQPAPQSN